MLKVLCIVDKEGTALDRLAKGVSKYHDNINYKVLAVHPKRPDLKQLLDFETEAADADIIDWQYFRTAEMLKEKYSWLQAKKQILTHNNPYSIEESDWNSYDLSVGNNEYIYKRLGEITEKPVEYIPICVDSDFWVFNNDWPFATRVNANNKYDWKQPDIQPRVIMVANRIESKKGILPVAIACGDLGIKFVLVGAISDMNYLQSIMATGNVEFHEQISDESLRDLYYKSTIHVCNSVDNFESGTMPILESMLCGVPVLTRKVGHVPELYNGENVALLEGKSEDVEGITAKLSQMLADKQALTEQRNAGWQTAKNRNFERRAYQYQKLYRQVLYPDSTPVSVVVPIFDKPDIIRRCLMAISEQTYKNIEIIVTDDSQAVPEQAGNNGVIVNEYSKYINFPIKYIFTGKSDYGLARARNLGTIEATGEVIVYCDQRMIMEPNAMEEFLKYLKPNVWLYGDKGGKKEFVENFSCVNRQDVIDAGMFNERIDRYGGMSQEVRTRFRNQGRRTEYVPSAKAKPAGKSSNKNTKRADIIKIKNRLWKMGLF